MTDPREEDVEKLANELFAAGREGEAPADARARALASLGLAGTPPANPPPTTSGGGGGVATKIALGALVIGTALYFVTRPASAPSTTTTAPTTAESAPSIVAPPIPPASTEAPLATATPAPTETPSASAPTAPSIAPSAHAPRTQTAAPRPSASAAATAVDDLAGELAAIDRARRAARGATPADALVELDDYQKRYPAGSLRNEALVVRVEALVKAGRVDDARRVAAPFLAAHPDDMASRRIRALLPAP